MLVKDLATKDVVSIDIDRDIIDALTIMFRNSERVLPVLKESRLAGTINIANYVKVLQELKDRKPESICVSEIMDEKARIASPNTPLEYVIDTLCEKGMYGVPVISKNEVIGMVTREDILKQFLPVFKGKFKVRDVMSYNISTSSVHDTLEVPGKKILTGEARRVVIMDRQRVMGTITIRSMANALLTEKYDLSSIAVADVLNPNPMTVKKSDDAAKAVEIMLDYGVGGVAVIDRELEGIVRDKDIIQRIHLSMLVTQTPSTRVLEHKWTP